MGIGGVSSNYPAWYEAGRTIRNTSDTKAGRKSETDTEMIVKPDGSRVLVMTMNVGGMETTMSLEISKPTKAPNENAKQDADEHNAVSDEIPHVSSEAASHYSKLTGGIGKALLQSVYGSVKP